MLTPPPGACAPETYASVVRKRSSAAVPTQPPAAKRACSMLPAHAVHAPVFVPRLSWPPPTRGPSAMLPVSAPASVLGLPRGQAKADIRRASSVPPSHHHTATGAALQQFEAALAGGAAAQQPRARPAWTRAMRQICRPCHDGPLVPSVDLLNQVLATPADAQAALVYEAQRYVGRWASLELRAEVCRALEELRGTNSLADVQAVGEAAAPSQDVVQRRKLFFAVLHGVPRPHLRLFLRAAECLLATGAPTDVSCVIRAARLSKSPPLPVGPPWQPAIRLGGLRLALPSSNVPRVTDEDRRIILAAMRGAELWGDDCGGAVDGNCDDLGNFDERVDFDDFDDLERDGRGLRAQNGRGPQRARTHRAALENVQNSQRIKMVKKIWAALNVRHPRVLPTGAVFTLLEGAFAQLTLQHRAGQGPFTRDASPGLEQEFAHRPNSLRNVMTRQAWQRQLFAERMPAQTSAMEALRNVWSGPGNNRMSAIVYDADVSAHLDETGLRSRAFVSLFWLILHAERPNALRISDSPALERQNLRHGFWNALLDNNVLSIDEQRNSRLTRLCPNGLAQRLLTVLEGYEPVRLNIPTAEELLCLVCNEFATSYDEAAGPTPAALVGFYHEAHKVARSHLPEAMQEVFDTHLRSYIRYTWAEDALGGLALDFVDGPASSPALAAAFFADAGRT